MIFKLLVLAPINIVVAVIFFRALFIYKSESAPKSCLETPGHERIKLNEAILKRFMGALDIPTISYKAHVYEERNLLRLVEHIENSFPELHRSPFVNRERVANYTLLYTIEGSDKGLRPYMLTSHLDVVPAMKEKWSSDPFKSVIKEDKHIYARGTIDAKHLMISMLEAFETMLRKGFKPKRSFYMVFGHDEELSGIEGAQSVARLLAQRLRLSDWESLEYILDEGNIISTSKSPGIDSNIALIGVAEKGYISVKINATGAVGHGSMPPEQTAIAKLSSAVGKFHSNMLPSYFGRGVEREMIEIFAAHSRWPYKLVYSNFWLFKPILEYFFTNDPSLNSLVRSSTAVTMMSGGTKENVLPDSAQAIVNHRIHPLQSAREILQFDRDLIDDPTIQVEVHGHKTEPTPVAPYCDNEDCYGWQLLKHTVLQVYPGSVVVPSLFLAASDSRWYTRLSNSIYKFSAIAVPLDEMKRFHGHDERISLENYENLINFFHHLIENSDARNLKFKPNQRSEL